MMELSYEEGSRFFSLGDILLAFVYTYEKLLKGRMVGSRKGDLLNCF